MLNIYKTLSTLLFSSIGNWNFHKNKKATKTEIRQTRLNKLYTNICRARWVLGCKYISIRIRQQSNFREFVMQS